ncbi:MULTISPECIES: hypothetical protein [Nitrosomonas]|uniref:hypothetical protein n=1 Tax=Nitrosomonas TaxID=914 RepID=UPI000AF806EA|nr:MULTISPECIES: hypothetical protein [Nitrosomonas]
MGTESNSIALIISRLDLLKTSGYSRCPIVSFALSSLVLFVVEIEKLLVHRKWINVDA